MIWPCNKAKKVQFKADRMVWELEKAEAKANKHHLGWPKPKWKDYEPEVLLARPKKVSRQQQ